MSTPTLKQTDARKRNFNILRLRGAHATVRGISANTILSTTAVKNALDAIDYLIESLGAEKEIDRIARMMRELYEV